MPDHDAKFNGLAQSYERVRPRYPEALFARAVELAALKDGCVIVDAGAGTGIGLDALTPLLPGGSVIHAVDISQDMIEIGRSKYPDATWRVGVAEAYLESLSEVDLVLAAQAYQWLDRPRFLRAARNCRTPLGVCMVVQNNRNHEAGGFLADYEQLLETYSPGYSRGYRDIDVEQEMSAVFAQVERQAVEWEQILAVEDFVTMSSSSTQAQRAVQSIGPAFHDHVRGLCSSYEKDGEVRVTYVSEGFYATDRE